MDLTHGKYLGVDYGDVRTGLAECDVAGMIAGRIGTVKPGGMRKTAELVAKEAKDRSCKKIIVGLPKNMDGSEGPRADVVKAFVALLSEITDIPIDFCDERMSTMVAYRFLGETDTFGKKRRESVDAVSAEVILQSYIDKERNAKKG
jgi:putative Holliday junction resolvase